MLFFLNNKAGGQYSKALRIPLNTLMPYTLFDFANCRPSKFRVQGKLPLPHLGSPAMRHMYASCTHLKNAAFFF